MNKRLLLALYDRSGLGAYMPVDYKGQELEVEEHWEKFAELIVRECIKIVLNCGIVGSNNERDFIVASREIKQHFGIEE
jgi:hypothetical protein